MNKKVLITGADGFIGSHLTELLVHQGYQVRALAQYNSFNHWGWLEDIGCLNEVDIVTGDIRDPYFCKAITKGCDMVFHLAALIAIPYSYVAPASYVDTNIKGTLNICQAALENQVGRLIHTSTSEVYGSARYVPIDEQHPLQPQSPYSASKIGADAMAMSFYHAFNMPITIARPFNTYGPRQSARAVIPTIISQVASGRPNIQLGDMSPTRDFSYVEDTCQGLVALANEESSLGETVNLGSNYEISIGDLFTLICELMGYQGEAILDNNRIRPKSSEVTRLWCENARLIVLTGYKPSISLREGLKKTIAWFTSDNHLAKYKTDIYNV